MADLGIEDVGASLVVAAGSSPDVREYWRAAAELLRDWMGAARVAIEYADRFGAGTVHAGSRASGQALGERAWSVADGRQVHVRVAGGLDRLDQLGALLPMAGELGTLVGRRSVLEHERRLGRFLVELSHWLRVAPSDPHHLLHSSIRAAMMLSEATGAFIAERRAKDAEPAILSSVGHGDWFASKAGGLGHSMITRVMDAGESLITENLSSELDVPLPATLRERIRAAVCVPSDMGNGGQIALCVFRTTDNPKGEVRFPLEEVGYLQAVTAHIAGALEIAHAVANVRQAARRASAMVNASPLPLALVGEDGSVREINRAWAALFGLEVVDEGRGRRIDDFRMTLDKATPQEALGAAHSGLPWRGRAEVARGADQRHCDAIFTAIDEHEFLVALHDRTDEILAHRERVAREKLATVGEIAGGVAHEINNPLAAIRMEAELIQMSEPDEEIARSVKVIVSEVDRAARIARGLLRLARPADGSIERIPVRTLIEDVVEVRSRVLRADGIDMRAVISGELPTLHARSGELEQLLMHIVTNAEQAVRGLRPATVLVTAEPRLGGVRVFVDDSGPGVPEELRTRIFDPFFTTRPPNEATGLGLALSQRIVADLGGHLSVAESPLGGARFIIDLPGNPG